MASVLLRLVGLCLFAFVSNGAALPYCLLLFFCVCFAANEDTVEKVCRVSVHAINGKTVECKKATPKRLMAQREMPYPPRGGYYDNYPPYPQGGGGGFGYDRYGGGRGGYGGDYGYERSGGYDRGGYGDRGYDRYYDRGGYGTSGYSFSFSSSSVLSRPLILRLN